MLDFLEAIEENWWRFWTFVLLLKHRRESQSEHFWITAKSAKKYWDNKGADNFKNHQ